VPDQWRTIVRDGYDEVAASYLAERTIDGADLAALRDLLDRLPQRATVLDAGCGAGVPVTTELIAAGYATVGLDFSAKQLALAQELAPDSERVQGDLARLPFATASFDAVVSYYAIIHVPRDDHTMVLAEVRRVLRPGGWSLLCLGASDRSEDHDPDSWFGTPMYWSHFDVATNRDLVGAAGLDIVHDQVIPDPMGRDGHLFVLARRPVA
jgi:ubiquinone/menaquinone biosynthesis C-methylase UbiE